MLILTYHSIDTSGSILSVAPDQFAAQMACLTQWGVEGISLREAVTYREARGEWPAKSVVLTFDDGYLNVYESAMPVLMQHRFTATVFLLSDLMGQCNIWGPPPARLGVQPLLSWEQTAELAAVGIELGCHTRTHPDLRRLSPQQIEHEIVGARDEIAARTAQPVGSFAYPFGYLSPVACATVQREFRVACTTVLKRVGGEASYLLPRIDMYYMQSMSYFKLLISGYLDPYLAMRRWGRWARQRWAAADRRSGMNHDEAGD